MRLLRDPLIHFLLIGAALFLLAPGSGTARGSDRIVISAGEVERLRGTFQGLWQRPPTRQELNGLVNDYVAEEVYYREALALGLDQGDAVIRRRLRQKMEFFSEDLAGVTEPTEAELEAYLAAHPDRFRRDARQSFVQIYFNRDRRGAGADQAARDLLAVLNGPGASIDPAQAGDPLMLGTSFERLTSADVAGLFGQEFADSVLTLQPGSWSGPIPSGYGLHLVRVTDRVPGRLPALAEVRDEVRRELVLERQRQLSADVYRRLRDRYTIAVEWPEWVPDSGMRTP